METTKSEMIEKLHALCDDIAEVEAWVKKFGTTPMCDDAGCCQEKGYHWFEVCDICIANGGAAWRLGDLADGVIALYNARSAVGTDRGSASGLYGRFVDNAGSWAFDAVAEALYRDWSPDDWADDA